MFFRKTSESLQSSNEKIDDNTRTVSNATTCVSDEIAARGGKVHDDGRIELLVADWEDELAYGWSSTKKWAVLTVIFVLQCSMNYNASVYGFAIKPLTEKYNVSIKEARMGQLAFLITYAFGCELFAPFSEEAGRWPILQLSLFLVNIWQLPVLFAPNFGSVLAGRILGGLSSAGGSVTLGMVADMWHADTQQYAVNWVVLASVGGSVIGPIVGGALEQFLDVKWNFISQLAFGVVVQAIHWWTPETRSDVLLDRIAKRLRTTQNRPNIYGPNEIKVNRFSARNIAEIWIRPFKMFITEPIVLFLSLLSGFSDALIFTFLEATGPVYAQWGFGPFKTGLTFLSIGAGYIVAWLLSIWRVRYDVASMKRGEVYVPEKRLWILTWLVLLLPIGLAIFSGLSLGPSHGIHWIGLAIATMLIGIANYSIYGSTVDYMIASYGAYSSSATGGNGFARDFLAGICNLYTHQLYTNVGKGSGKELCYASLILFGISLVVVIPVYIFYYYGSWFRVRSRFAMSLAAENEKANQRKEENMDRKKQSV